MVTHRNTGFTLVELLAALAVLAIIIAIAVPHFAGTIKEARQRADKASALIIAKGAEQKWIDDGKNTTEDYLASELAEKGYLREAPKPQSLEGDYDDFKAFVNEDGRCEEVVYLENGQEVAGNLIDNNEESN